MNKYDAWLESPYREAGDAESRMDQRIAELMHGEMNPHNFDNFMEALYEECLYKHKDTIEEALEKNDKAMLGLIIQSSVYDYWEGKAVSQADEEEANGDL